MNGFVAKLSIEIHRLDGLAEGDVVAGDQARNRIDAEGKRCVGIGGHDYGGQTVGPVGIDRAGKRHNGIDLAGAEFQLPVGRQFRRTGFVIAARHIRAGPGRYSGE